jgi:hypothetical protein
MKHESRMLSFSLLTLAALVSQGFAAAPVKAPTVGTVLPVMLDRNIDPETSAGAVVLAKIMQEVPLPGGGKIPLDSKVTGHVISVSRTEVVLQFDALQVKGETIPMATSLRAIAGPLEVQDALTPIATAEIGVRPWEGNTIQVGGEAAYRDADLIADKEVVGKALAGGGALGALRPSPEGCPGDPQIQALWVFSTTACGVYGKLGYSIEHAGDKDPLGKIVLRTEKKKILVRRGSGLMLRVVSVQR